MRYLLSQQFHKKCNIYFRYWAVTQVNYIHQRNIRTIGTMIFLIWLTSVIVSLAPLMGWKDEDFLRRINEDKNCMVRLSSFHIIFKNIPVVVIMSDMWVPNTTTMYEVSLKRESSNVRNNNKNLIIRRATNGSLNYRNKL